MAWLTILNMVCGLHQDGLNNSVSSKGLRLNVTYAYPNGSDGDKWTNIGPHQHYTENFSKNILCKSPGKNLQDTKNA